MALFKKKPETQIKNPVDLNLGVNLTEIGAAFKLIDDHLCVNEIGNTDHLYRNINMLGQKCVGYICNNNDIHVVVQGLMVEEIKKEIDIAEIAAFYYIKSDNSLLKLTTIHHGFGLSVDIEKLRDNNCKVLTTNKISIKTSPKHNAYKKIEVPIIISALKRQVKDFEIIDIGMYKSYFVIVTLHKLIFINSIKED